MNFDYEKLANARPEQIETLVSLMEQMEKLEAQKIKTLAEMRKAIAMELPWPGLWKMAKAEKLRVTRHWIDDGPGSASRRSPKLRIITRTANGGAVEIREFPEREVPATFERPDWWKAKR